MNNILRNTGRNLVRVSVTLLGLASAAGIARAGAIPYPDVGVPNATDYAFTATSTGEVDAYFAGSGASYDEQVGLYINGVLSSAGWGLDDHTSSVGQLFDMGNVTAGDSLVFADDVFSTGGIVYSDPTLNVPYDGSVTNHNHVYSTSATAGQVSALIPAGTYVAFEDLSFPDSDYNYFDDTFVFTNVSTTTSGVPDASATLSLLGLGVGALAAARRKFKI
jgi:protein with PEP-CTERM/exosortase system signal